MNAIRSRRPVLLVHGFLRTAKSMKRMQRWLEGRGWEVSVLTLSPSDGSRSLNQLAEQLAAHIDRNFRTGSHINLIGYSMGGLICRDYVQRLHGLARVERLITISTPHNGTRLAYLSPRPGCREMRPTSSFLNSLNNTARSLELIDFTSIWTPLDLIIVPATSSRISIGRDCKRWVIAHPLMIWQQSCLLEIEQLLAQPLSAKFEKELPASRHGQGNSRLDWTSRTPGDFQKTIDFFRESGMSSCHDLYQL